MDFKMKGKSWVGNIYHQFESICQDFDEFMSKDTVKYVENKVQNVGVSVKKLYSHVLQDTPSGDNAESNSQSVSDKQVDTRVCPLEQVAIDCSRNYNASSSQFALNPLLQFTEPYFSNPSQNATTDIAVWEDGDSVIWNDANSAYEETMSEDVMPVTVDASSNKNSITVTSYEVHKDSDEVSVDEERSSWGSFSDDVESIPTTSRLIIVEDPDNSNEDAHLSQSVNKAHEENSLSVEPPYSVACDAAREQLGKDEKLFNCVSAKDESFDFPSPVQSQDLVFSYFSSTDEESRKNVIYSSSTSQKFSDSSEHAPAILTQLVDRISCSSLESNGNIDVLTLSSATEACETKPADIPDNNGVMIHGLVSEIAPSEVRREECHEGALPNFAISPSENGGSDGFGDVDMETVDLSPKVKKPDGTTVVSNINFVRAASHGRRDFRYYKKLLQDAIASRKRLSKEYEHLDILYGDIDIESSRHFEPSSLPSSPIISVQAGRTQSFHETSESGWELL